MWSIYSERLLLWSCRAVELGARAFSSTLDPEPSLAVCVAEQAGNGLDPQLSWLLSNNHNISNTNHTDHNPQSANTRHATPAVRNYVWPCHPTKRHQLLPCSASQQKQCSDS